MNLKLLARQNRKNPTQAESLFWNMIVRKKLSGYRFIRQKVLGKYIVDFYCPSLKLAIELDGSSHQNREDLDYKRDQDLKSKKIMIIRYPNDLIENQLEGVYYHLQEILKNRAKKLKE